MLAGGLVFVFVALATTIPRRVFRTVCRNATRVDGTTSGRRIRTELRELGDVVGNLIFGAGVVFIITVSPLALVHTTIVPIPMVADIFGAFDVDATSWEAAIETEALGDVGAQYEAWGAKRGYSESRLRFWQEFLWSSWPMLLGIAAVFGIGFYWFMTRYYLRALSKYGRGVVKRERKYIKYDNRHNN